MRARRFVVALALCATAAAPMVVPGAACAGEGGRAALVIDTGSAITTYCVVLPDGSVSGLELVELAGDQHGLDYSFGFGGEAVCRLEGVGPEGDDCFGEYPEFWGYWHGDGSGGWSWAGTGAGSATIEDGDTEGWSWGTGDNGSNHQAPPETEHDDVCPPVAEPARPPEAKPSKASKSGHESDRSSPGGGAPRGAAPAPAEAFDESQDGRKKRRPRPPARHGRERKRDQKPPGPSASPSPEPTSVASEPVADESNGGPPVTGLLGLAAAATLGAVAWRGSRRKSKA